MDLANYACKQAALAFGQFIKKNNLKIEDWENAATVIKRHVKAELPQAMEDAKKAFDANMKDAASQTFAASMRLSGINAGKEILEQQAAYQQEYEDYCEN